MLFNSSVFSFSLSTADIPTGENGVLRSSNIVMWILKYSTLFYVMGPSVSALCMLVLCQHKLILLVKREYANEKTLLLNWPVMYFLD